jgi:ribosome-associated translation inhibitor RaiA
MKMSVSYKSVQSSKEVEIHTAKCMGKLGRLLKSYAPDLVQLHGVFSENPRTSEYMFSLNLSLPTGTLHATGIGRDLRASCKQAFNEIEVQVKKHQAKLRKDYEWKRKRERPALLGQALS